MRKSTASVLPERTSQVKFEVSPDAADVIRRTALDLAEPRQIGVRHDGAAGRET